MRDYGVELFKYGARFHTDGRHRRKNLPGWLSIISVVGSHGPRGAIKAFTEASRKRLDFVAANAATDFRTLVTLTYHARAESWEGDDDRNRRIVLRSKRDLNRFLTRMRGALGAYLWVQEFQERGVIHYHLICDGEPEPERVALVWCRATDALDDAAAMRHATKVERINSERGARSYLGHYLGKGRQKLLPAGVVAAGRWWGRSRSLELAKLDEIIAGEAGMHFSIEAGQRAMRCLKRYVGKVFKGRFRGGAFVDRGGKLAATLAAMATRLREYFGTPMRTVDLLTAHDWEVVGKGDTDVR